MALRSKSGSYLTPRTPTTGVRGDPDCALACGSKEESIYLYICDPSELGSGTTEVMPCYVSRTSVHHSQKKAIDSAMNCS